MSYTGNSPEDETVLRLQARKSFALGLWIQDYNGNPLDIAGTTTRIVVRKNVPINTVDDSANIITNSVAEIIAPTLGLCRFNFQASDLDAPAGDYVYSIVMVAEGYSSVIVAGPLELEQNTEFTSVGSTYAPEDAMSSALTVTLRAPGKIIVRTGPTLAPGAVTFTQALENMLLEIYSGAVNNGAVLNAEMIPDGATKVIMTLAERLQLANMSFDWDDITGKPAFGDIIIRDAADFLEPSEVTAADVVSGTLHKDRVPRTIDLRGTARGTAAPAGGADGDIYLKYTP